MQIDTVVILDYGSQYTKLIARRVRECEVFSMILPGGDLIDSANKTSLTRIKELNPKAVILSGGPNSVYDDGAPQLPKGFLDWAKRERIPVLGVCYGMQLLTHELGGQVTRAPSREYGRQAVKLLSDSAVSTQTLSPLFSQVPSSFNAWMSHGDEISKLPDGFSLVALSDSGVAAAMQSHSEPWFGLQFHPEVVHTEGGKTIIANFLFKCAHLQPSWKMNRFLHDHVEKLRTQIGQDDLVICGLSGGVDSTVAAVMVSQAIGSRLHCIFVDHGLLRHEERSRVLKMFREELQLSVVCFDASENFLNALAGVEDPEKKRKIIGEQFIRAFERASKEIESKTGMKAKYLVQGTLYPDVIESGGSGHSSATIKSHHNVGGLPKDLSFALIEPLRELFKDEVRILGKELKIPDKFLARHPFPGPGLAVRVLGAVTTSHLEKLRHADEIFISEIERAGLYSEIWQAFAVFLPIKSVGVQGDGRTHDHVIALRAVTSVDGMTADWYHFDSKFLAKVSSRICNEVRGIGRVVYDISSKPPATIEWE